MSKYTDKYFTRTKDVLKADNHNPEVVMQVFQRNDRACICGTNEIAKEILAKGRGGFNTITCAEDGVIVNAWDTVMHIEGHYQDFVEYETEILGILARQTKVATNAYNCFAAANGKRVILMSGRFDAPEVQKRDGYAFGVGLEAADSKICFSCGDVTTEAQAEGFGIRPVGTMPHSLIAAYGGDTVKAMIKFAEYMPVEVPRICLVDFDNDCLGTTANVIARMYQMWRKLHKNRRFRMDGIRLDTSGSMVDVSVARAINFIGYLGNQKITGVCQKLISIIDNWLIETRASDHDRCWEGVEKGKKLSDYVKNIQIGVSGGFNAKKIAEFKEARLPVDFYGVGSSIFDGNYDFTADIVKIKENGVWRDCAKKGRRYIEIK